MIVKSSINIEKQAPELWRIDPLFIASVMLTNYEFSRAFVRSLSAYTEFIKQFKEHNNVEALLVHLPTQCLEVFESEPELASIPFDRTLFNNGATASYYANMDCAQRYLREHWGKAVACALLFVNNLYPKLHLDQDSDSPLFPIYYASDTPLPQLEIFWTGMSWISASPWKTR